MVAVLLVPTQLASLFSPPLPSLQEGLARVEAGAQGEHKISRGFLPHLTYSAHWFPEAVDEQRQQQQQQRQQQRQVAGGFPGLVARYLAQERADVEHTMQLLRQEASPYKDDRHE